jgi:tungstate transport system substrate-binding protein
MLARILLALVWLLPLGAAANERFITVASTTSTEQSGFFERVIPLFRERTGIDVRVVAVGTGQASQIGQRGDADALLVHDRQGEDKFVAEGHGLDRRDVMFNDFVLVGAKRDPAGVGGLKDAREAFRHMAQGKTLFVSRGDDSGTHGRSCASGSGGGEQARGSLVP